MILVSVYDVKSQLYGVPMTYENEVEAIRGFTKVVNQANNPVSSHPEDFSLRLIGAYDRAEGIPEPYQKHKTIAEATNLVSEKINVSDVVEMSSQLKQVISQQNSLFMFLQQIQQAAQNENQS